MVVVPVDVPDFTVLLVVVLVFVVEVVVRDVPLVREVAVFVVPVAEVRVVPVPVVVAVVVVWADVLDPVSLSPESEDDELPPVEESSESLSLSDEVLLLPEAVVVRILGPLVIV